MISRWVLGTGRFSVRRGRPSDEHQRTGAAATDATNVAVSATSQPYASERSRPGRAHNPRWPWYGPADGSQPSYPPGSVCP